MRESRVAWRTVLAQPWPVVGRRCWVRLSADGGVEGVDGDVVGGLLSGCGYDRDAVRACLREGGLGAVTLDGFLSGGDGAWRFRVYDAALPDRSFSARWGLVRDLVAAAGGPFAAAKTVKVRGPAEMMVCERDFLAWGFDAAWVRYGEGGYNGPRSVLVEYRTARQETFVVVDFKEGEDLRPVFVCAGPAGSFFEVAAPRPEALDPEADGRAAAGRLERPAFGPGFTRSAATWLGRRLVVCYWRRPGGPSFHLPLALGFVPGG